MVALVSLLLFLLSVFLLITSPIAFKTAVKSIRQPGVKGDYTLLVASIVGMVTGVLIFLWNSHWVT